VSHTPVVESVVTSDKEKSSVNNATPISQVLLSETESPLFKGFDTPKTDKLQIIHRLVSKKTTPNCKNEYFLRKKNVYKSQK